MLLGLFAKACNQIARKVLYLKICRKARGNMGLSKPETGCWKIQQMPSTNLSTKSKVFRETWSLNLVGNYRSSGLTIARGTAACQNCFSQKSVICDNNKTALI